MASAEPAATAAPVAAETVPAASGAGDAAVPGAKPKELTKKELRKLERERKAIEAAEAKAAEDAANFKFYGDFPLNQSREVTGRVWTR